MTRAHLDLRRWTLVLVPVATLALAALASAEPAWGGRGAGGGGGSAQIVGIIVKLENAPVVTYHKDVQPIIQTNCQSCHRPGQVGPFSLTTYKQAVSWAEDIKDYTASRKMPPWKPTGGVEFANARHMNEKDIRTLAA